MVILASFRARRILYNMLKPFMLDGMGFSIQCSIAAESALQCPRVCPALTLQLGGTYMPSAALTHGLASEAGGFAAAWAALLRSRSARYLPANTRTSSYDT